MVETYQKQDQYKVFERHGQLVFALNSEITIPLNAPVRLLSAQLEELEYGKLYKAYSPRGRKSAADPRVLFKVMVHGYLCGIYSSRKLEEACQYRIDFRWLLEDQKAPDHTTFARFRTGRCREVVEDLFYQFVKKLEDMRETDHQTVYIDGTKLESAAGRYTFVWRKPIQKRLAKVKAEHQNGQFVTDAWYRCEDCAGCPCRAQCCRAKDPNQPEEVVLQRTFWEKREQATRNISSERGIQLRVCRSIQVEGAFALLKNDFGFRRFLTRGKGNIRTELFFLALAFDLKKLWMKREYNRLKTRVSLKMVS